MLTFLPAITEFAKDKSSQTVWGWIEERFHDIDGVGYYKYPVVRAASGAIPELTLITRTHEPLAVRCLSHTIDEIQSIENDTWTVNGTIIDSPLLE